MPPLSAESAVVRTYIEWLRDVPWFKKTRDNRDIDHAMHVLNEDSIMGWKRLKKGL
jgi:ATP-dependent Lon protease